MAVAVVTRVAAEIFDAVCWARYGLAVGLNRTAEASGNDRTAVRLSI